jgi:hypothetical protein
VLNYGRPVPVNPTDRERAADLIDYLSIVGGFVDDRNATRDAVYRSLETFVLNEGRAFTAAPLPDHVDAGEVGYCYQNALTLALADETLRYVEGFATHGNLPVPLFHAWCVDDDGNVVDPTWTYEEGSVYYGVEIDADAAMTFVLDRGWWGVLPENVDVLITGNLPYVV